MATIKSEFYILVKFDSDVDS